MLQHGLAHVAIRRWAFGCGGMFLALTLLSGCVVPQPPGRGLEQHVREPRLGAEYFLYLPEAYVKNNGVHPQDSGRRWPVVMTFHGLKPYDTWDRQIHEWQQEADAYGYIVCAPWLQTCDGIFMQFPLRKEHDYVLRDKDRVMACLDHVLSTTRADPNAVLSTSWSSGGFMAHYFPNKFPHRFRCIATRLSNFSPDIMTDATVPLYRDTPVAVFIGESDFPACIRQSQEAVAWYRSRGFNMVEAKVIDGIGHKRIPQTAAAFFARRLGIEPLDPAAATRTLAELKMRDWTPDPELMSLMAPRPALVTAGTTGSGTTSLFDAPPSQSRAGSAGQDYSSNPKGTSYGAAPALVPAPRNARDVALRSGDAPADAASQSRRGRGAGDSYYRPYSAGPKDYPADRRSRTTGSPGAGATLPGETSAGAETANGSRGAKPVSIQVTRTQTSGGPLYVAFSTNLSDQQLRGADFLWSNNGKPICDTARGVKAFDAPGTHTLSVLAITRDGQQFRGSTTIHVPGRAP